MESLFNVYVMNLKTGEGKYYDIATLNDLQEAIQEVTAGMDDYEIQIIDTYFPAYSHDFKLDNFLKLYEEHYPDYDAEEITIFLKFFTFEKTKALIKKRKSFFRYDKETECEALKAFLNDMEILEIPRHLENYIDWEKVLTDYKSSGWMIEVLGNSTKQVYNEYFIFNDKV